MLVIVSALAVVMTTTTTTTEFGFDGLSGNGTRIFSHFFVALPLPLPPGTDGFDEGIVVVIVVVVRALLSVVFVCG